MKILLTHGSVMLSILLVGMSIAITNAFFGGDRQPPVTTTKHGEADYMYGLMDALTPTPPNWSIDNPHCNWEGIACQSDGVVSIKLPSSSLSGVLPPRLNTLTDLAHIDFYNNSLTGTLPDFSNLTALETVYLGNNNFNNIPPGCFKATPVLQTLSLRNNWKLAPWPFTTDLFDSPMMHTLDLKATNIVGTLPLEMFDSFPRLDTVVLSKNYINGLLPPSLGKSLVRCLKLDKQRGGDGFQGTIHLISSMTFLSQAWLNNNKFNGSIPKMSNSTHLFDLRLHSNHLTGLVPPSLLALTSLKKISLDDNYLQGPIPVFPKSVEATWKGNIFCRNDVGPCDPQVTILLEIFNAFLDVNMTTSSRNYNNPCMDWDWVRCEREEIVSVDLGYKQLKGTISPIFSNLTSLVSLTLAGNALTGSIPDSLTTLPHLQLLDISHNNLSGKIPNFSFKVELITQGNALLALNSTISGGAGGGNSTNSGGDTQPGENASPIDALMAGVICVFSVGFVILIVLIVHKRKKCLILVQRWIFKKTAKTRYNNVEDFIHIYNLSVPIKQYRYAEVKRMTNSFRDKLGQGGYGIVYKASLPNGRQVAVKIINESKGNGEEFINEVASISRTSHVNIVSLLGFCCENKRALIYEFMSNGSLDNFILKSGFPDAICSLDWNTLSKITIGIARGLEYLHEGCISRILHLDIKPQNILLDEDFCPKISDFGLAKICQRNDSVVSILGARGTIGYIAPEVFSRTNGGVSHKSDVYSYGMLILDMIGRRKNSDMRDSYTSEMYFPDWIYKDLEQDNLENCSVNSEEEIDMVRKITMVSLWCIQTKPSDRPAISKVIEMLQAPIESVPYPPKPFLYPSEIQLVQTSYVSSNDLLVTNSPTLSVNC